MTTFATGNPIGSTAPKDLYDNAENLDYLVLGPLDYYPDRLGAQRLSYRGMENQANTALVNTGFEEIGDYDSGPLTITRRNQVFTKSGQFYGPGAALSLPYTTVNNWTIDEPKFVNRGDFVLRQDLAATGGAARIGALDADGNPTTVQAELLKAKTDFILVDSIASARLVPATFKGVVATLGYYANTPGSGMAMYRTDTADTTSADNSFTTLVSTGGVRRKIMYTDKLTVRQAGARGDYTKTSNTGTDDAVALQRAHDLTPRGVTVFYELGLYFTTTRIYWNGGSSVVFQSRATSTDEAKCAIVGASALDGVVESRVGDTTFSTKVENAVVTRQTGATSASVRGLICSGVDQQVFIDCASYHHGICVHVNGQLAPVFERLNTWDTNGYHVKISTCVEPRFLNCRFGRNGGADRISDAYVLIDGATGISVDTVDFTACQFNQSGQLTNSVIRFVNYNNPNGIFTFTSCHLEGWGIYVVNLDSSVVRLQRLKFIGCTATSDPRQQFIGGNGNALEDFQIADCTLAVALTLDQVNSASMVGGTLDGPLIINRGRTKIVGVDLKGNVTLQGTTGDKLTFMANQLGGTLTDNFTGTRAVMGNI